MKKYTKISNGARIAAVAVGILLLAGCANQGVKNQKQNGQSAQNQKQEQKGNGVVSSIKDAMGLGKTMRCTYRIKDQNGDSEVVTYVDGKKYATQMTVAGKKQRMVYDGETMYSWADDQKQGMKMTKSCADEMNANMPKDSKDSEEIPEVDAEKSFDNAMDVKCEEVQDADFSVPSDVSFSDQCEILKGMMKNIPQNMGGQNGAGVPEGMPENMPNIPKM